jgi:hypothetical protein
MVLISLFCDHLFLYSSLTLKTILATFAALGGRPVSKDVLQPMDG